MDWKDALSQLSQKLEKQETVSPDSLPAETNDSEPLTTSAAPPRKKGTLKIVIEKKGRGGKTATIICGFEDSVTDEEISRLAARLKKRLSTGGSARGGEILIQGDRREDVARLLAEEGYKVGKQNS